MWYLRRLALNDYSSYIPHMFLKASVLTCEVSLPSELNAIIPLCVELSQIRK